MDQTGAVLGPLFVAASVARTHHFGPAFFVAGVYRRERAFIALLFARWARPKQGNTAAGSGTQTTSEGLIGSM
jgi:hypothetical protein